VPRCHMRVVLVPAGRTPKHQHHGILPFPMQAAARVLHVISSPLCRLVDLAALTSSPSLNARGSATLNRLGQFLHAPRPPCHPWPRTVCPGMPAAPALPAPASAPASLAPTSRPRPVGGGLTVRHRHVLLRCCYPTCLSARVRAHSRHNYPALAAAPMVALRRATDVATGR
jgi:hypothetical protein